MPDRDYFVHESSFVDEPCSIGAGTRIWHFSHVMKDAVIGRDCVIGQNVLVASGVRVGDGCKIQNNVSLYTGVTLEDHVFCGPSLVFTNVVNPRSEVVRKDEYRPTLVKQGATLGANATIVCGVTIGAYAFVGAGAVVTRDIGDYALAFGNPAQQQGWMCRCGIRLGDGVQPICASCGRKYELHAGNLQAHPNP
jgi:UDP-2-acetamido-3-amino-2,3-dideoxy-glucuronate N-acetyltransferase